MESAQASRGKWALSTYCVLPPLRVNVSHLLMPVLVFVFLLFFQLEAQASDADQNCGLPNNPEIFQSGTQEELLVWTLEKDLRAQAWSRSRLHEKFINEARTKTNTDQTALLQRQRSFYRGTKEEIWFDRILNGSFGRISPLGCLDGLLFERFLQESAPGSVGEFQAFLLERAEPQQWRVYFQPLALVLDFRNQIAPKRASQQIPQRLRSDLKAGWKMRLHLHNHPFLFLDGQTDIAGTVIPSANDRAYAQKLRAEYGLEEFWITNGIDTFQAQTKELFTEWK